MCLQSKSFENTVGKGETATIPNGFPALLDTFLPISSNFICRVHKALTFDLPKWNLQMAYLLIKENNCADFFWNPYLNIEESVQNKYNYGTDENFTLK